MKGEMAQRGKKIKKIKKIEPPILTKTETTSKTNNAMGNKKIIK
jgi:hypothetical protein